MIRKSNKSLKIDIGPVPAQFPNGEQGEPPRLVKTIDGEGGQQSAPRNHLLTTLT